MRQLKKLGYDYVELPMAEVTALSEQEFESLRAATQAEGIACQCFNVFFPQGYRLTGPEADLAAALGYGEQAARRAAALGGQVLVFGSGAARRFPEGFPPDKAWAQLVALGRGLAEILAGTALTLAVEPLNVGESNILTSVPEAKRFAEEVDRPQVKILADYYHMAQEGESIANSTAAGTWLRHTHFADPAGRVFPQGPKPGFGEFFAALKAIGYTGGLSVEAAAGDFARDAEGALGYLREAWATA
jgi:sugar phosphate isomerase/epimerase